MTSLSSSTFRFRRIGTFLFVALFALVPFRFATAQSASKGVAPMVSVNIALLSLDNDITGLKYDSLGKSSGVIIYSSFKQLHVAYSGPAPLVLYRETKLDDGKPVKKSVIEINFPQTTGTYLVVVKQIGLDRYVTKVIRDDPTAVSLNSWRFINLSSRHAGFVFTEFKKSLSLASGQTQEIDLGAKDAYSDGVAYLPDPKASGKWAMANSAHYLHTPGRPRTVFLLDDPGDAGHLFVKTFDNAVKRPSSKPGAANKPDAVNKGGSPAKVPASNPRRY
jgi:hypothetical protein